MNLENSMGVSSPKSPRWSATRGFFDGAREVAYLLPRRRSSNVCLNHTTVQPTTIGAMIVENSMNMKLTSSNIIFAWR